MRYVFILLMPYSCKQQDFMQFLKLFSWHEYQKWLIWRKVYDNGKIYVLILLIYPKEY